MIDYSTKKNRLIFKILISSLIFISVLFISLFSLHSFLYAEIEPYDLKTDEVVAESALVMDFDSGEILWEKNINRLLYPASITKIMSGIVAIEMIDDLNETVKISKNASGRNSSFFAFEEGDEVAAGDLLKAALINSQNNSTVALAEHISGDVESFINLMNDKAKEIGAESTNFENTSGLDSEYPNHRSTAQDIAIITRYAMQDDVFSELVKTREDYIEVNDEEVYLFNTNKMLLYGHIKGVKTGFTNNAGHCIVIYSEKDDLNLITVVLNSDYGQREKDVLKLLRWAYVNFENKKILDSQKSLGTILTSGYTQVSIQAYPEEDVSVFLNKKSDEIDIIEGLDEDVLLPVEKGQRLGVADIILNGNPYASIDLISISGYEKPKIEEDLEIEGKIFDRWWIFIILIGFYFFVFIIIIIRNLIRPKV